MKTFLPFLLIMLLCGCVNNQPPTPPPAETPQTTPAAEPSEGAAETPAKAAHPILGSYVGLFEAKTYDARQNISWSNKITVFLDSISGDRLYGHSVVAGNARPFSGPLQRQGEQYTAEVREPGDDQYDGLFLLRIDANGKTVSGTWRAYKKLGVSERQYNLERRQFRYDPKLQLPEETGWADLYNSYDEKTGKAEFLTADVTQYNASARLLKKEEVENLYKSDLEVIRNAIYARHGYSFKNRRMRYVFDTYVDWYMPVSVDIRDQLTAIEKQNIDLLKRYEQHAERYYDEFGR